MALTKEQLLAIGHLKIADRLGDLDGNTLERYYGALTAFVEDFPGIEADLKKALFINDGETLTRVLAELSDALANIHANDLVGACERMRGSVDKVDPGVFEADLIAFLSATATLSVDIQMEQHKSEEAEQKAQAGEKPKTRRYEVVYAAEAPPKSVLAVDDIPVTLNLLRSTIVEAGYKFNGVTSGAAALDYVSKFTPDLFILDIEMPKMDGFELAAQIREAGHKAPIIFLTGNAARDYLMRAVRCGAVDFIVKPINVETITSKIHKVLGMWNIDGTVS
jgi:CheY-like chemotaxis protein